MRKLDAADLTFIAEELGRRYPAPMRYLEALSRHADPVVREGVAYGLARAGEPGRGILYRLAREDQNAIVRQAAREALEWLDEAIGDALEMTTRA